jgi:hypothetical protein
MIFPFVYKQITWRFSHRQVPPGLLFLPPGLLFHHQVVDNFSLKVAHTDTPSRFSHAVPEYIHAQ